MENATINQNWKTLIKPNKLQIENNTDKSITTVIAEPLEKGYALTIGNSLRRILLSSIQGSAITAIQIDGVLHEFSSIKGVREDVTDIVLNVKSLSIQVMSEETKKLILDVKGPGEIKAKDIQPNPDVKILNPDLVLCHLDENTKFHRELMRCAEWVGRCRSARTRSRNTRKLIAPFRRAAGRSSRRWPGRSGRRAGCRRSAV